MMNLPRWLTLLLVTVVGAWALSTPAIRAEDAPAESDAVEDDTGASGGGDAAASPDSSEPPAGAEAGGKGQFWEVQFEEKYLRMVAPREGPGAGRVFWYLIYTLHNPDDADHEVFTSITAVTDGKKEYSDLYLPTVEKAIEKKEREPLWGKTDEFELISKRKTDDPKYRYVTLRAKETRKCVAVFNAIDPNVSKITIRVAGLSNEIRRLSKEDGSVELEDRVRELYYTRPGDEYEISIDKFRLVGKEWVAKKVPLVVPKTEAAK